MLKIKLFINIFFFILIILIGCKKVVRFGEKPKELQADIAYEKGKIYFKEERLEVRYVITKELVKEDKSNNIIFYFHGFNRTELEWINKDGFGNIYYNELRKNSDFKSFPVVSISLGGTFLFLNYLPKPFDADTESLFINKIVPYFKEKLNSYGKVFLVGHSMGGFNALTLSLRNPELFPVITIISPYVAPISPFTDDFDKMGEKLKMPKLQVNMLKNILTKAFQSEEEWYKYNPFKLIEKNNNFPFIIMSTTTNDLPGFEASIKDFDKLLSENKIKHYFCDTPGDHNTTCKMLFFKFLEVISSR